MSERSSETRRSDNSDTGRGSKRSRRKHESYTSVRRDRQSRSPRTPERPHRVSRSPRTPERRNSGTRKSRSRERRFQNTSFHQVSHDSEQAETASILVESESVMLKRQLQMLKNEIEELRNKPSTSATFVGDEFAIPVFDSSKNDITIEMWVKKVDTLAERYKWSDEYISRIIAGRLRGHAQQWYYEQTKDEVPWAVMKIGMMNHFRKSVPFAILLKDASNYEARPGQNLGDYCFKKLTKLRALKLQIPDECLIDAVIGGIKDDNIVRTVRSAQHNNADNLYAYLSTLGKVPIREVNKYQAAVSNSSTVTTNYNNRNTTHLKRHSASVICFNCGGTGHYARDCRKTRVECSKCKKLGHKAESCTEIKNTKNTFNINAAITEELKGAGNMFMKTAVVNNHKCVCLIDSGSAKTIIKSSVAQKFKVSINQGDEVILKSFMGTTITCSAICNLTIRIMEVTVYITAIIVADDFIAYDLIVGRDFLDQPQVMLIKKEKFVILRTLPVFDTCSVDVIDSHFGNVVKINNLDVGDINKIIQQQLMTLLNNFKDCISTTLKNLGKTDTVKMEIKCLSDVPIVYRPYRLPEIEKAMLRKIIAELLENGIIQESQSPYASPVILVKKKSGDYRMCCDYRRLNAVTVKNKLPLPLIEEQIDQLGGYKYFITLDLASGYYQVPMATESIAKTAFVTPDSHYEFLRMPFGLTNAPAVFQQLINTVLGELRNSVAFPYIDDIIIPAETVHQGLERLKKVLEKFRQHKLTLKLSKCSFFKSQVEYLGRIISADGVKPGKKKVEAVMRIPAPTTVKQIRQFIGLTSYFRKFIKDYAIIAEPLTRLTRKEVCWHWGSEQERAFKRIKEVLSKDPIIQIFNPKLRTELHTDASSMGLGAILMQYDEKNQQHVVSYFSKQTTNDQRNYHAYELETMAVIFALRYFRVYLLGMHFKLVTDCNALRTTLTKKDLLPRIGRWWLEIQEFTFEIEYRSGAKMLHVDALSRNPIDALTIEVLQIDLTEGDWILAAQLEDEQLVRIRQILEKGDRNNDTKQYFKEYEIKNNKIFRKFDDGSKKWVVPKSARMQICRLCHDDAGHLGAEKTIRRIKNNYWFSKMRRFVSKYVKACLNCAYYKNTAQPKQCKLNPIEKHPIPFYTLHMDHVGPFETSKTNNKFLLVIVDAFTKFCVIEPVRDQRSRYVIKAVRNLIYLFGVPNRIISDRGTAFTSKAFKIFCATYGIKHILNAVASPRSNGQCERYNKTIVNALSTTSAGKDPKLWDTFVKPIQSALNTSFNKSINTTPMEALIGWKTTHAAEATLLNEIQSELHRLDIQEMRKSIAKHITQDQKKQKERYDRSRREAIKYNEGDLVMIRITSEPSTGGSKKLFPKYKGPFRVHKKLLNDRYEVEDLREGTRRLKLVVAADNMKYWVTIQNDE